jgi:hypothetical protein
MEYVDAGIDVYMERVDEKMNEKMLPRFNVGPVDHPSLTVTTTVPSYNLTASPTLRYALHWTSQDFLYRFYILSEREEKHSRVAQGSSHLPGWLPE